MRDETGRREIVGRTDQLWHVEKVEVDRLAAGRNIHESERKRIGNVIEQELRDYTGANLRWLYKRGEILSYDVSSFVEVDWVR